MGIPAPALRRPSFLRGRLSRSPKYVVVVTTIALVSALLSDVAPSPSQASQLARQAPAPTTHGTVPPPGSRPFATLPHLGPSPQRCFPYGGSVNICTGPSWPYPPNANYLDATYYGTVFVSPHVVEEGQTITADAVVDNKGTPGWPAAQPGPRVAGCKKGDVSCSWKATVPSSYPPDAKAAGGGWSDYTMGFCGFFGCANSQDFYYVLPHKSAISGMVLDPYGDPVPNAVVKISGPSTGTAVSGADGFYDALVDPGKYVVTATVDINGTELTAQATECAPGHMSSTGCSVRTGGDDAAEVDFALTCAGAASVERSTAPSSSQTITPDVLVRGDGLGDYFTVGKACPLYIKVTEGDTGQTTPFDMKSGLSLLPGDVHRAGFKTPADFAGGATFKGQCVSGCVDLLVSVTGGPVTRDDAGQVVSTGKGLDDVEVTASVTGLTSTNEVVNTEAGNGDLCTASSYGSEGGSMLPCAATVTTKTGTGNAPGEARIRYWGPASWQRADRQGTPAAPPQVRIEITAKAHLCLENSECTVQETPNPVVLTVNIQPHRMVDKTATLGKTELLALKQWASSGQIVSGVQSLVKDLTNLKVFDDVKLLKVMKTLGKKLKLGQGVSDFVILELFQHKFGLVQDGLEPDQVNFDQIEGWILKIIENPVYSYLAGQITKQLFGPSNVYDNEMVALLKKWAVSDLGGGLGSPDALVVAHLMTLKVYEASFCLDDDCVPGAVPAVLAQGSGIHYNLFFAFSSTDASAPSFNDNYFDSFTVNTGYVAPTWLTAQCASPASCVGRGT